MNAMKPIALRKVSRAGRSKHRRRLIALAAATAMLLLAAPNAALAMDFPAALKRVDHALRTKPSQVSQFALDSCFKRRNFAIKLYESRQIERAQKVRGSPTARYRNWRVDTATSSSNSWWTSVRGAEAAR